MTWTFECKVCGKEQKIHPDYCSLTCKAEYASASYEASVLKAWDIVHDHIRASMDGVQSQIRNEIVRGNKSPRSDQD